MLRNIIVVFSLILILIAVIKLQIFLSKKDSKLFGLIIPIVILAISLLLAFGGLPTNQEIETIQSITTETGEIVENSLDAKTPTALVDNTLTVNGIIYTIIFINAGNSVMLGIFFYCRHQKKTHVELKRMKAKELF